MILKTHVAASRENRRNPGQSADLTRFRSREARLSFSAVRRAMLLRKAGWSHPFEEHMQLTRLLLLLLFCSSASAEIIIQPSPALTTDSVRIRLVNQYGSAATVTTSSIVRTGSQFAISQTVSVACMLPVAPVVESTFDVGPLPAGDYTVVASISNVGEVGCPSSQLQQQGAFTVSAPLLIPVAGPLGLGALAVLMLGIAFALRKRDGGN